MHFSSVVWIVIGVIALLISLVGLVLMEFFKHDSWEEASMWTMIGAAVVGAACLFMALDGLAWLWLLIFGVIWLVIFIILQTVKAGQQWPKRD